jgi:hypothetical protein
MVARAGAGAKPWSGGPKGILVVTGRGQAICRKAQVANAQFGGQPGKADSPNPRLATPACAGYRAKRHRSRHGNKHAARRGSTDVTGGRG